jgi:hypothetical protein
VKQLHTPAAFAASCDAGPATHNARMIFCSGGYQKSICGFGQSVVGVVLLANYFVSERSNVFANVRYLSSPNGLNGVALALGDVTMGGNQTCAMVGIEQTC